MKKILFILAFLLSASGLFAQMTVTVSPRNVGENEKFAVTYSVNGSADQINAPAINGCKLMSSQPGVSQMTSYQNVNGRVSSGTKTEYTFTYRAGTKGSYTIPAASAVVNGKRVTSKSQTLKVGDASAPYDPAAGRNRPVQFDDPDTQTADRAVKSNDVFIRIILNKSTAYEQEAIECTIKLYTKYSITSFFATKQPAFDGFLIQEMNLQDVIGQQEVYNGQSYMTALLKKCIIFPQKSGKLTINSGDYDLDVVQYENINMGIVTVRDPIRRKIHVTSNTASIEIKPLPTPKPANFSGAVGNFSVNARLVGNSFKTNEPATYILSINGTGNIKYIPEPQLKFPEEFEMYSPKSDIKADVNGSSVTGQMKIEYTFVPQSVGDFTIPAQEFVFFNPAENRYVTLDIPAKKLKVAKGSDAPKSKREASKMTDILPIHAGDTSLSTDHTPTVYRLWYWLIYIILTAGFIITVYTYRRHIKKMSDVIGMRLARAGKVARRRLKRAHGYMVRRDAEHFYEELLKAMWGYLSDKLVIPVSQLNRDNVSAELEKYGAPQQLRETIIEILDDCEMARYTPESSAQINQVYDKAASAIDQIENIKKEK